MKREFDPKTIQGTGVCRKKPAPARWFAAFPNKRARTDPIFCVAKKDIEAPAYFRIRYRTVSPNSVPETSEVRIGVKRSG